MTRCQLFGMAGLASLGAAASCLSCLPAAADDLPWDNAKLYGAVSVRDRPRTAFEPDGIRIGNYMMLPEVGLRTSITMDSLDSGTRPPRDLQYEVGTGVEFRSQLPRHLLDFKAKGRAVAHHDQEELRYIDGKLQVIGRLDIDHRTSLFGRAGTELLHEESIDEERPKGARRPPALMVHRAEGGLQHHAGRIDTSIGARYARFDYQDAEANDGSAIDQDARSFSMLEPFAALGLRLSPGYRVFSEVSGRRLENRGNDRIDRDAEGFQAGAGVELELSPLVRIMMKGGYFQQDYLQPGLIDIATHYYEGRLDWYVTPLVSLTFGTARNVYATSFGEASGRIVTAYSVKADYEMWRNLIVSAEASYKIGEYIGEAREDKIWMGRVGVDYMASKHWLFTFGYEHQELQSSESDVERKLDKVTIGAKYRF